MVLVLEIKSNINEILHTYDTFLRQLFRVSIYVFFSIFLILETAQVVLDSLRQCLTPLGHFYHKKNKSEQTLILERKTLHAIV